MPTLGERRRRFVLGLLVALLASALLVVAVLSIGSGKVPIEPGEVLGSLLRAIGIDALPLPAHPQGESTLWTVRLPRVVMAIAVGIALAVAGLVMQAIFGNPLAEPAVVGVSSGAALGAATVIALGATALGEWVLPGAAFVAGLCCTLLVYAVSRAGGRTEVVTLLLTGIAVNAFTGAGIALMVFLGSTQAREQIVFWQLGSLNGSRWQEVAVVVPVVVIGLVVAALHARRYDLLALGERSAGHLGVHVERLRIGSILLVALIVGVSVAFTGVIAFVGLVVPHLMRMLLGPAHGPLLVTSALGGALLLVGADLVARTAVGDADLPIGMLTALVGGPFFFFLIWRTRRRAGGWG